MTTQQLQEIRPEILEEMGRRYLSFFRRPCIVVQETIAALTGEEVERIRLIMREFAIDLSPEEAADDSRPEPSTAEDAAKFPHKYWNG